MSQAAGHCEFPKSAPNAVRVYTEIACDILNNNGADLMLVLAGSKFFNLSTAALQNFQM